MFGVNQLEQIFGKKYLIIHGLEIQIMFISILMDQFQRKNNEVLEDKILHSNIDLDDEVIHIKHYDEQQIFQ